MNNIIKYLDAKDWIPLSVLYHETNDLSSYIEKIKTKQTIQQPISLNYPIIQESTKSYTLLTNCAPQSTLISDIFPSTSTNIINDNLLNENSEMYKNVQILTNKNLFNLSSSTLINSSISNDNINNFNDLSTTNNVAIHKELKNNNFDDKTSTITSVDETLTTTAHILNV